MKIFKWFTWIMLIIMVAAVSACGKPSDTKNVRNGINDMLQVTADLSQQITADNSSDVKSTAPKLESDWSSFEDKVKGKYPDNYEKVEKYLDPLVAAAQSNPSDQKTLTSLNQELRAQLMKLQQLLQ